MKPTFVGNEWCWRPEQVVRRLPKEFRVTVRTLANWRLDKKNNRGPFSKRVQGRIYYPVTALSQWMLAQGITAPRRKKISTQNARLLYSKRKTRTATLARARA